jgi:hypothetical protein
VPPETHKCSIIRILRQVFPAELTQLVQDEYPPVPADH